MKKIILGILILGSSVAFAQSPQKHSYHKSHEHHSLNEVKKELNLSDEQVLAMQNIYKEYSEKFKSLKDSGLNEEQRKEESKKLRKEKHQKINTILTPEQQTKFKEHKKSGKKGKKHKTDYTKLQKDLGLTDAQVNSWKELNKDHYTKAKAVKENSSLDEAQKREQMKDLRFQKHSSLKSILSEQQYAQYKEMKGQHKKGHNKKTKDCQKK